MQQVQVLPGGEREEEVKAVKTMRQNIEKVIISNCLKNGKRFAKLLSQKICREDFEDVTCGNIFDILQHFYNKNYSIPSETVVKNEHLSRHQRKLQTEGKVLTTKTIEQLDTYYAKLTSMPLEDEESYENHIARLNDCIEGKELEKLLENKLDVIKKGEPPRKVADSIIEELITKRSSGGSEVVEATFYELMSKGIANYNPCLPKEDRTVSLVPTGVQKLDMDLLSGGIPEGNFVLIAGRPGSGKTALVRHIARKNAQIGKKVLFISLEMSLDALRKAYYAQMAEIEYKKVLQNRLTTEEFDRLAEEIEKPENKLDNLYFYESDSLTISELINVIIRYKKEYDIDVVCLDYVQLIKTAKGATPRDEQDFADISEAIRIIIKKYKLVGFLSAQVNRDCEKRPDKRPMASDMRSSGKFEQDAACILTTYRDEIYNKDTEYPRTMDISSVKCRFGKIGMVRVLFDGEYQNIGNLKENVPIQAA